MVIGRGGEECNAPAWGWYVYESDDYRLFDETEFVDRIEIDPLAEIGICRADADGVRPISGEQT